MDGAKRKNNADNGGQLLHSGDAARARAVSSQISGTRKVLTWNQGTGKDITGASGR